MTDATAGRLARALFALSVLCLVGGSIAALLVTAGSAGTWRGVLPDIAFTAGTLIYTAVGMVIARRQPKNAVAWVLLGVGFAWQLELPAVSYVEWATQDPERVRAASYVSAVSGSMWVWGLVPLATFLLLLYPDGHLPTARWRWWARFSGAALGLASLSVMMWPGPLERFTPVTDNPIGVQLAGNLEPVLFVPLIALPVAMIGSAVALILRFRRSRGVERLQMKWLAASAGTVAGIYLVAMVASVPYDWIGNAPTWVSVLQNVSLGTFLLIPIAVGTAITRHRLYDIDRLINRALVYGVVSALLIAVYALGVVGAGGAMRAVTGQEQGNLAVAASTLAVAALFRPFRARVQGFIDRRFYRGKYDAAQTVEAFSARLRQETDLGALSHELRAVITATVHPDQVALWIADR